MKETNLEHKGGKSQSQKAAMAQSSPETKLARPCLPWDTSLGGYPFETEATIHPSGMENSELWTIKD